ncbi:MAG: hypothetical protein ACI9FN_003197, partial [Saprospiraceae bacterium]
TLRRKRRGILSIKGVENKLKHIPTLESVLIQYPKQKWVYDLHSDHPLIVD